MGFKTQHRIQLDDIGPGTCRDALSMMLGEKVGAGHSRRVYINDLNPRQVVKVDMTSNFNNVMEWKIWENVKETGLAKWLAPCDFISPGGDILIQRRTYQPKKFPDWIPSIFTDLKLTNFGVLPGSDQLVCHDYAMLNLDRMLFNCHLHFGKATWWRLGELEE